MEIHQADIFIRIILYIILGLVSEVLFTGVMDIMAPRFLQSWLAKNLPPLAQDPKKRDPRAMGYTFLWMIPIYALLIILEPLAILLKSWPFYLRGLIYLAGFWFFEYVSGAVIKKLCGYVPWDYSYSRYSVKGYIRWDYAPIWYSFSLVVEWLSYRFIQLTPAIRQAFL